LSGDVDLFSDDDDLDIRQEIIEPAIVRRKQGYGEIPPDYKRTLGQSPDVPWHRHISSRGLANIQRSAIAAGFSNLHGWPAIIAASPAPQ
jgi:hypothetical protein